MKTLARSALLLALALFLSGAALAEERATSVLSSRGEVFALRAGLYGELFPGGAAADPLNPVLALDLGSPGQLQQRLLVPDTGGPTGESSPFLVYEDSSDTLYLVWQALIHFNTVLCLRSYHQGVWSDPIEIYGNYFAAKGAPQLAITRDTVRLGAGTARRTVLHLVWWEDDGNGGHVLYTPIVLLDGNYAGTSQIIALNQFTTAPSVGAGLPVSPALYRSPRILPGANEQTVMVAFADWPTGGRVTTVQVSVIPGDLSYLADDLRAHIIQGGSMYLGNLTGLADDLRAHIIQGGSRLDPGVLHYLADDLRAHIIQGGLRFAGDMPGLAAEARQYLLQNGAVLLHGGLRSLSAGSAVMTDMEFTPSAGPTSQQVEIRPVTSFQPLVTGPGAQTIVVSDDGSRALVAWEPNGSQIEYCESQGDGWTERLTLDLGPGLDRATAYQLLLGRLRNR